MDLSIVEIQNKFPALSFQDLIRILESVKKSTKEKLLALKHIELTATEIKKIQSIANRLENKEPIDYILGYKYFYDNKFQVTPDVLIPRPETELLVDHVINIISNKEGKLIKILEIGTGSGCISISILDALSKRKSNKTVTIIATDISTKALRIAEKNALSILTPTLNQSLKLIKANIVPKDIKDKFDIIISNPPYIPSQLIRKLDKSVQDFEPISALDGGQNGIDVYKAIIEKTKFNQKQGTIILFEIDETSLAPLKAYLDGHKLKYEVHKDFRKQPRIMRIKLSTK